MLKQPPGEADLDDPRRDGITVGELIAFLLTETEEGRLSLNATIKMASDAEGNEINLFGNVGIDGRTDVTFWPGHGGI